MNVIVVFEESKKPVSLLLRLESKSAINEVKALIEKARLKKAIIVAVTNAVSVRPLAAGEINITKAQLILTPKGVHWDLT